jgi:SAM-dependent methyltransferase
MSKLLEHVARNRAYWDDLARQYVEAGESAWAQEEPAWGIWHVPEAELQVFSEQLSGKDAIELGCGTAYISAWLSRRGVRVVGIDNSDAQLDTARRLQRQYGLDFPLIHGDAEAIAYPDASFDFAISEYGACLWADPQQLGSGGRAPVASRRSVGIPHQLVPDDIVHATGGPRGSDRATAAPGIRDVPSRMAWKPRRRVSSATW